MKTYFVSYVLIAVLIMAGSVYCVPAAAQLNYVSGMISGMEDLNGNPVSIKRLLYKQNIIITVLPVSQGGSMKILSALTRNYRESTTSIFLMNTEEFISQSECKKILRENSIESKLTLVSGITVNHAGLPAGDIGIPHVYVIDRSGKIRVYTFHQDSNPDDAYADINKVLSLKKVMHNVTDGETLSGIALQYFSSTSRWTDIYKANRDRIRNPTIIYPGQILIIPLD